MAGRMFVSSLRATRRGDAMRTPRRPLWRAIDFILIIVVLALAAFVIFTIISAMRA